ncbi:MAG: hypothetical protein AAB487_00340, partial [Patescibacteria group bacterium]
KKQFNRAAEGAFASESIKQIKAADHLATILRSGESKFKRTQALLSLVRKVMPVEIGYDYKKENLPFSPESYEFKDGTIGQGGENDVYLLESKDAGNPSWALKINHQDKGDVKELTERAKEIKSEYEKVKSWYETIPDLVPKEYSVILEGPRDSQAAIATLQEYYGSEIRDIFRDISKEELNDLLAGNPSLSKDLFSFIKISEEQAKQSGEMIDFLGPKNISLIKVGGTDKLILLDPHLISNPQRNEEKVKVEQWKKLESLREFVGQATLFTPNES